MLISGIFFIFFCFFTQLVFAQNTSNTDQFVSCQKLQKHAAQLQLNSVVFFSIEKSPIFISICRDSAPKVFEQFFAYLHTSKAQPNIIPKAGLNRMKTVIKPEYKVFATGVVALQQKPLQQETVKQPHFKKDIVTYQLRIRVRINDGDFTDLVVDMNAQEGQVATVDHKGFSIALLKP